MELNPNCTQDYWTDKRLSEEVITSINTAVIAISNNQPVSLVGFSGGGGVAVLLAVRNKNIQDIITIAGNLDIDRFSNYHNVYALKKSLNPIKYARAINHIPQLHISGDKDSIVPSSIAAAYVTSSASTCVHSKVFLGIAHNRGWEEIWQTVLKTNLSCKLN